MVFLRMVLLGRSPAKARRGIGRDATSHRSSPETIRDAGGHAPETGRAHEKTGGAGRRRSMIEAGFDQFLAMKLSSWR